MPVTLCSDCPPANYTTSKTRCAPCPRRTSVVNLRTQEYDILIDRRTELGNPFRIGPSGSRTHVIALHRAWLKDQMAQQPKTWAKLLDSMRGKRLGCHCFPLPCHGDNYVLACDSPEEL